jgi:hypothetical protein
MASANAAKKSPHPEPVEERTTTLQRLADS